MKILISTSSGHDELYLEENKKCMEQNINDNEHAQHSDTHDQEIYES